MDETAKTEVRNYLSAAGFFVIAAFCLLIAFFTAGDKTPIQLTAGLGLLLIGTLLIVLRKRDMIAMFFVIIAFFFISLGFIPEFAGQMIIACFTGLVALTVLITLTGKDKAKWLLILIPLGMIAASVIEFLSGTNLSVTLVIPAIISIYFAFACACERISLPGRKLLTADEETDFRASGSVLGYLLFAVLSGAYVVYYVVGENMMHLEYLYTINIAAAVLLIFIAVLLFAVGKMRFTPAMFLLIGLADILAMFSSGAMFIGCGILFIIIGVFAMLRKESRILPGIMLIVYGCTGFFSTYTGGSAPVVSIILNAIPCLIAIYLAFVVYSQKKLPKF